MSLILAAIAMGVIYGLVTAADKLTPAGILGENRILVMFVVMVGLITGLVLVGDAVTSAPSHPSLAYSPAQYRLLMKRKCIFQVSIASDISDRNALYTAYCTALDLPDLPPDLQGLEVPAVTGRPMAILDDRNIWYRTTNFWLGSYNTDEPLNFDRPVLLYKDGSRPENSILRFWETKTTVSGEPK